MDKKYWTSNNVTAFMDKLQEQNNKFSHEIEELFHHQELMIEAYRKIDYELYSFKKYIIKNIFVDTIIISLLIISIAVAHFKINSLEKKVEQYEQNKVVILEDDSTELVSD